MLGSNGKEIVDESLISKAHVDFYKTLFRKTSQNNNGKLKSFVN